MTEEEKNFKEILGKLGQASISLLKNAGDLPNGSSYDFYATFNTFKETLDRQGLNMINLSSQVLNRLNVSHGLSFKDSYVGHLEDRRDALISANDNLFELIDKHLDYAANVMAPEPEITTVQVSSSPMLRNQKKLSLVTSRYIARPQAKFKIKPDNRLLPFVPLLRRKPNAISPLSVEIASLPNPSIGNIDPKLIPEGGFVHPYQGEIESFLPDKSFLACSSEFVLPGPVNGAEFISKEEDLIKLVEDLSKETELAFDLEHHSYRSFLGLTCLMQISSRHSDYIVDTLELHHCMHHLLDILTNPSIVKVFHGAVNDNLWLQRDLGLYVVNSFDTGQAARLLNLGHYSLAYLLDHFCNIKADKTLQLSDWRIRPLPEDLVRYAISDTHYLLYIYDRLKWLLSQCDKLYEAWKESSNNFLTKYEKPIVLPNSHFRIILQHRKSDDWEIQAYRLAIAQGLTTREVTCLERLYNFRDEIARENDEGYAYIIPNHMLLQIAKELPKEASGILALCNPVPPLVRQYLQKFLNIILECRELSGQKPELPFEKDELITDMKGVGSELSNYFNQLDYSLEKEDELSIDNFVLNEELDIQPQSVLQMHIPVSLSAGQSSIFPHDSTKIRKDYTPLPSVMNPYELLLQYVDEKSIQLRKETILKHSVFGGPVNKDDILPSGANTDADVSIVTDESINETKDEIAFVPPVKKQEEFLPVIIGKPVKKNRRRKRTMDDTMSDVLAQTAAPLKVDKSVENFVAKQKHFNYESLDLSNFLEEKKPCRVRRGKGKSKSFQNKEQYDPYKKLGHGDYKPVSAPKIARKFSNKSQTFFTEKSNK